MDAERIDRWCERGIFGLTIFILIFGPVALGAVRWFEFVYIQAATIGIALLWLIRCWSKPAFEIFWPPVCWPVLAFLVYAVIRYFTADIEYVARLELMHITVYAVLFLAVLNNLHRQEYVQIITWVLVILAAVLAVYALIQFSTSAPRVWGFYKPAQYLHRGSGTYINPNHLAGFLELALPLGIAVVLLGRTGHSAKIIFAYLSAIVLVGIGVTLSRGGWIATLLMLVCFFVTVAINTRGRWIIIFSILLLFAGMASYVGSSLQLQKRFQIAFGGGKVEDARFTYWQPTLGMWKDHLWTGVGPGHFDIRLPNYRTREVQVHPQYAHNDYLNTLSDWGIIGGILVLAFLITFYLGALQAAKHLRRKAESGEGRSNRLALVFAAAFGLLVLLFHSVTDFNMQLPANAISLFVLLALAMTQLRHSDSYWIQNFGGKICLTAFLLITAGFLGIYGAQKARENFWLQRANASKTWQDKVAALEKAAMVEKNNPTTPGTIAEILRQASFKGEDDYKAQAEKSLLWYQQAMKINPFSPYHPLGYGMSLDWLGRTNEAGPYFTKALELDPKSYYTMAHQGWHAIQLNDYPTAEKWFNKSIHEAQWSSFAAEYLEIIRRRMEEAAAEKKH